jgi:DNA-directed RNA polymerase subunit RPC12/RpoP
MGRTTNPTVRKNNSPVRCPECGSSWQSLEDLQIAGGQVRSAGEELEAVCPGCGFRWSVNHLWRVTTTKNYPK